jgi:hypothetical protein
MNYVVFYLTGISLQLIRGKEGHYTIAEIVEIVGRETGNCILYFLNLLYYTYVNYWFDCILARGTALYQYVLESVGFTS